MDQGANGSQGPGADASMSAGVQPAQGFEDQIRSALNTAYAAYDERLRAAMEVAAANAKTAEAALAKAGLAREDPFMRHMKCPDAWRPKDREEELVQWKEFKFQLGNWLIALDSEYLAELRVVQEDLEEPKDIRAMTPETRNRALRLYSILCTVLRSRPLSLLRQFEESRNGYEAYRILLREMEPCQRMRSLALARELASYSKFEKGKSLHEQLVRFEELVQTYEACSGSTYSDDLKMSTVISNSPEPLRSQLQLRVSSSTTYNQLREMILQFERLNTKWTGLSALPSTGESYSSDGPSPMDVGQVGKGKGWGGFAGQKGKGKKGKGKSGGKGKKGKSKEDQQKGKGKKGGSPGKGKGGKPGKSGDVCNYCGKTGHWKNECWKRQQDEKGGNIRTIPAVPDQGSQLSSNNIGLQSQSSTAGSEASSKGTGGVRRVRLLTPPLTPTVEIFDLTEGIWDEEQHDPTDFGVCAVRMHVDMCGPQSMDNVFDMAYSDSDGQWTTEDLQCVGSPDPEIIFLQMVSCGEMSNVIILDSGADCSVAPMWCQGKGAKGQFVQAILHDAQGATIPSAGSRRLEIACKTYAGEPVVFKEEFVIGNVQNPLMSLGRLMRRGWTIATQNGQHFLSGGKVHIPLYLRRNTLVMDANICVVDSVENPAGPVPEGLQEIKDYEGWHILVNDVLMYSEPNALHYMAGGEVAVPHEYKARVTLLVTENGCNLLEQDARYMNQEDPFRLIQEDFPSMVDAVHTLTFFFRENIPKDIFKEKFEAEANLFGVPPPGPEELIPEMPAAGHADDVVIGEPVAEFEADLAEGVVLDELHLDMNMTLRQLREICERYKLPSSGGKSKCLGRLKKYKVELENRLTGEIASKLFAEERRAPIVAPKPRAPSKEEQERHAVSHLPYAPWCESCIAGRARNGPHQKAGDEVKAEEEVPVIQLDYAYGYTDSRGKSVQEVHENQFGITLVAVDSQVGWITALPVVGKGALSLRDATEQICRHLMRIGASQVVVQTDPEPSILQVARSIQECRARMGLKTSLRRTGVGEHQSNGRVEKAISTMRRMAVTLKHALEEKVKMRISGDMQIFPWLTRHAGFLLNHFQVNSGSRRTAYEMIAGHAYRGVMAELGEVVFFYQAKADKAEAKWQKGVWAGKSSQSDSHILLTEQGAFESRVVRRIPDESRWNQDEIVKVRALPWDYTGLKMRMKQQKKPRPSVTPAVLSEREALEIAKEAAAALAAATAGEEAAASSSQKKSASSSSSSNKDEAASDPPSGGEEVLGDDEMLSELVKKRSGVGAEERPTKQARAGEEEVREPPEKARKDAEDASPSRSASGMHPPVFAGQINAVCEHNDGPLLPEDYEVEMDEVMHSIIDEEHENQDLNYGDEPPCLSEEELVEVDRAADVKELTRLVEMNVMRKATQEELQGGEFEHLTTKIVRDWRKRPTWIRRSRLVAREYKFLNPGMDGIFAPASNSCTGRVLILAGRIMKKRITTFDVKDAYLRVPQEKPMIVDLRKLTGDPDAFYVLLKMIPGQRAGAAGWYGFADAILREYGLKPFAKQPTIYQMCKEVEGQKQWMALDLHADDGVLTGDEALVEGFLRHLGDKVEYSRAGPFGVGDEFKHLKKSYEVCEDGLVVRADERHIKALKALILHSSWRTRTTPCDPSITKEDKSELLKGEMAAIYRQAVGRLLYLSPERPDVQFTVTCLAAKMTKPTMAAYDHLKRLVEYLVSTEYLGLKLEVHGRDSNFLYCRGGENVGNEWDDHFPECLNVECFSDSDWAGNAEHRRSTTSVHVFVQGALAFSFCRSQKSITLSSAEAEFCAILSGACESIMIRDAVSFLLGEFADVKLVCKTDSSSARSLTNRLGTGRMRHLQAGKLWIQEHVMSGDFTTGSVPGVMNPADLGTKALGRKRLWGVLRLVNMVDDSNQKVGVEEYGEIRKGLAAHKINAVSQKRGYSMMIAIVSAILQGGDGASLGPGDGGGSSDVWAADDLIFAAVGFSVMVGFAILAGGYMTGRCKSATWIAKCSVANFIALESVAIGMWYFTDGSRSLRTSLFWNVFVATIGWFMYSIMGFLIHLRELIAVESEARSYLHDNLIMSIDDASAGLRMGIRESFDSLVQVKDEIEEMKDRIEELRPGDPFNSPRGGHGIFPGPLFGGAGFRMGDNTATPVETSVAAGRESFGGFMQRLVAGEVDEAEVARVMEEEAGLRRRRSSSPVRPGERQSSYLSWLAEEQEAGRISEEELFRRMGEIHRNWSELVHGEETRDE